VRVRNGRDTTGSSARYGSSRAARWLVFSLRKCDRQTSSRQLCHSLRHRGAANQMLGWTPSQLHPTPYIFYVRMRDGKHEMGRFSLLLPRGAGRGAALALWHRQHPVGIAFPRHRPSARYLHKLVLHALSWRHRQCNRPNRVTRRVRR